jgi:integrase
MRTKTRRERRRGQIVAKGDGCYLIRFFIGRQADGRRKYSSRMIHGSYRKAEQELTKVLREIDTHSFIEPSRQTLAEYLDRWLDTTARLSVSERTLEDYRTRLKRDVLPAIGAIRLDRLSLQDVQQVYSASSSRGHSPRTVRYTHAILKQALEKAVIIGLLIRNPAQHAVLPKQQRAEMKVLSRQQVSRFLVVTETSQWHALWSILLLGGLRPSEALALRWSDLEGNRLHIVRALKKLQNDRYSIASPKTERSRRAVFLPDAALRALREHRARQALLVLSAGPAFERNDLMFPNAQGRPMDLSKVRRLFKRALAEADLPQVRLYDCRHSHATLLLSVGENPKIVSERLGHTTVSMTLDTYSHVLPDMQQATAERIDEVLRAALG